MNRHFRMIGGLTPGKFDGGLLFHRSHRMYPDNSTTEETLDLGDLEGFRRLGHMAFGAER